MEPDKGGEDGAIKRIQTNRKATVCPYLRLRNDPLTSALYARPDHVCGALDNEPIELPWQMEYCVGPNYAECPFYQRPGAAKEEKRGLLARLIPARHLFRVVALVVLLIVIGTGGYFVASAALAAIAGSDEADTPVPAGELSGQSTDTETGEAPAITEPRDAQNPAAMGGSEGSAIPEATSTQSEAAPFASEEFEILWMRTDAPVRDGTEARSWIWGPEPISQGISEVWESAPGGERVVQYFEHGRMEPNHDPDVDTPWRVSSGLLAKEMIEGVIQTGIDSVEPLDTPAAAPVVGTISGVGLLTYEEIGALGLTEVTPRYSLDDPILQILVNGASEVSNRYAEHGVTAAYQSNATGHFIASPFWEYMNTEAPTLQNGELVQDRLFEDPFHVVGYPLTEPYWARIDNNDEQFDVLWQCFERRCLTYYPENDPGMRITSAATGRDYYTWRYESTD